MCAGLGSDTEIGSPLSLASHRYQRSFLPLLVNLIIRIPSPPTGKSHPARQVELRISRPPAHFPSSFRTSFERRLFDTPRVNPPRNLKASDPRTRTSQSRLNTPFPRMAAEKPSVLVIGGLGYIGRFLALHIHKNDLASEVRLVDKVLPQLAWLAPEFDQACSNDKFIQADATRERESWSIRPVPLQPKGDPLNASANPVLPFRRSLVADIRPSRRQRMGLCLQLWRRDEVLTGRRSIPAPIEGAVSSRGAGGGQTQVQVLRRVEHGHGVQA